jgi:hypothetical protein
MTSQTIPACKDCNHYHVVADFIPCCKIHYFEEPDYINGIMDKIEMIAINARENEKRCGPEGKDFEQREVVEEEETFSYRKWIKGFFTDPWMF